MVLRSLQRDRDFKNFYRHSNCYIIFIGIICLLIETHLNSIIYADPYHFNPSVFFKSIQRYWHLGPQHNAFSISTSTSLSPPINCLESSAVLPWIQVFLSLRGAALGSSFGGISSPVLCMGTGSPLYSSLSSLASERQWDMEILNSVSAQVQSPGPPIMSSILEQMAPLCLGFLMSK